MNFTETYYHVKENVYTKEYRIYKYLNNMDLKFIPKLYSYDKEKKILKTQRINGLTIADLYGEDFCKVPKEIVKQIRKIIRYLYNIGIIYPDITGYNFIQDKQKRIWILDFEHSFYINKYINQTTIEATNLHDDSEECIIKDKDEHLDFVDKFCFEDEQSWNPYFA